MNTMHSKRLLWIALAVVLALALIVVVTAALTPEDLNPAFATAVEFTKAAASGDDAAAHPLLSDDLLAHVTENCPNGSASACVGTYIPPEWGDFLNVVYRRAAPDDSAWNVELIATYEQGEGGSGVCIYNRVEQNRAGAWRVTHWAGFISCGDAASRNMATNPDAPNRAP
jgi:hypothetical protein